MPESEPAVPPPTPDGPVVPQADRVGRRTHPLTGAVQGALWALAAVFGLSSSFVGSNRWGDLPLWVTVVGTIVGGLAVGQAAGFLGWWFTRFVVDDTELRIDRGILTRSSRRIPFERIQSVDLAQPFLPRLVGLAELRIDMAGGEDSRSTLRFLALDDARATRRLLLDLAHGRGPADQEAPEQDDDLVLVAHVPPGRVVLGALLSVELLGALAVLGVLVLAAAGVREPLVLVGGVVPTLTWAARIVGRQVVAQWDFSLHRTPRGLRIERGLFSRTSQTIPFARVQGVAVEEPIIWRRLGWQRLQVDVAGYAAHDSDDVTATSNVLLPIADRALAASVVRELTDGGVAVPRTPVPSRGWWFAPVGWRYRWVGADERVAVASTGWLWRRTSVVPHVKAQSVALRQGPLQRRLGLASVDVHSPDGPVDVGARHLDVEDARAFVVAEVDRARAARRGAAPPQPRPEP
ncbi:MAG: PH domain-containing protein [Aeromicrobium erythreum]